MKKNHALLLMFAVLGIVGDISLWIAQKIQLRFSLKYDVVEIVLFCIFIGTILIYPTFFL